ncbi:uncharacterized protein [Amphiura filiformis]|uniref:uncharacterized protein isoform X2 n=1 Tax=Amphiura filiformis TaxID=82378 RepID=UPI003B220DDF
MMEPQQIYSVTEADFLENEEFDFDLPVSPVLTNAPTRVVDEKISPAEEDEDEVFFGPVGFREQCVAKKTELDSPEGIKPMSPLTTEQYVEIFKEATKVALLLKEQGTDNTKCAETEANKSDEPVNQLTVSISELALKPSNEGNITPNKLEMNLFKRAVKKDMRSPRRTTYTISVSPAGHTPPAHLPTAKECVSSLVKDQPAEIKFTAKKVQEGNLKKPVVGLAATKKSRLPAKRSGIPKTSGLRKPKPVLQKIGTTKQSPPKRTRLANGESNQGLKVPSSPVPYDTSENNMVYSGKRRTPGSNNPVQNGLCKPARNGQEPTARNATNHNGASKPHASKLSLMKPGVIPRKTLAAARPSKLAKSTSAAGAGKLQPMKATMALDPKKTTVKPATPKVQIPCTPVVADKNVPKRILSSGSLSAIKEKLTPRTSRAYSVDSAIKAKNPHTKTPVQRKPSVPGTPQKSSQKVGGSVTGSSRRRSGIPTPHKRSVSSASRLNSTSSIKSHQSPRTLPMHGPITRIPSPIETPPAPQISPALPTERARQDNTGASPVLSSVPIHKEQVIGRAALAEIQESHRNMPSPQIDLLIKLDTPSPLHKEKAGSLLDGGIPLSKKCLTPLTMNPAKENLIDLL